MNICNDIHRTCLRNINSRIRQANLDGALVVYGKNIGRLRDKSDACDYDDPLLICSLYIVCKEQANAFSNGALLAA